MPASVPSRQVRGEGPGTAARDQHVDQLGAVSHGAHEGELVLEVGNCVHVAAHVIRRVDRQIACSDTPICLSHLDPRTRHDREGGGDPDPRGSTILVMDLKSHEDARLAERWRAPRSWRDLDLDGVRERPGFEALHRSPQGGCKRARRSDLSMLQVADQLHPLSATRVVNRVAALRSPKVAKEGGARSLTRGGWRAGAATVRR